jgi:hypothetical protein
VTTDQFPERTVSAMSIRERNHLEGVIGEYLARKIHDDLNPIRDGGNEYRAAYSEEAVELGYDDDDPEVIIRRNADGAYFEVEIDIYVRPVAPPEEAKPT